MEVGEMGGATSLNPEIIGFCLFRFSLHGERNEGGGRGRVREGGGGRGREDGRKRGREGGRSETRQQQ